MDKIKTFNCPTLTEEPDVDSRLKTIFRGMIRDEILSLGPEYFASVFKDFPPLRTYTREEVCKILHCSAPTFYRLYHDGILHTVKRGKALLVMADDLDAKVRNGYIAKYRRY